MAESYADPEAILNVLQRQVSRRSVLRRTTALGLSISAAGTLLAACGGDDDDNDMTPTAAAVETPTNEQGVVTPAPTGISATPDTSSVPTDSTPAGASGGAVDPATHYGYVIEPAEREGGTLIIGTVYDFFWIGTKCENWYGMIESLLEYHPDSGEPSPLLAESYEVSGDGTLWTWNLRQGVTWHDGEPFTADDVRACYDLFAQVIPWYSGTIGRVTSQEVVDDYTLVQTLGDVSPQFAWENAVYVPMLAEQVLSRLTEADLAGDMSAHPLNSGIEPEWVIGTGPFALRELVVGDHLTLVRYDDYWGGRPHLDEIIYKLASDSDALATQLDTGEVDMLTLSIGGLDPAHVDQFAGSDVRLADYPGRLYFMYQFNLDTDEVPLFDDVRVRHAMQFALDRPAMLDAIFFGYGVVADSTVNSRFIIQDELTVHYDYDPERAQSLLEEAGWAAGADGIRAKSGERFSFRILITGGDSVYENFAAIMQEYWRQVGLEATIDPVPASSFYDKWAGPTSDFDIVVGGFSDFFDQRFVVGCEGNVDYGTYCNLEVDELMSQALIEFDPERQRELMTDLQNIVMTDLPLAPLIKPNSIMAVNQRVHNVFANEFNRQFNMESWWIDG